MVTLNKITTKFGDDGQTFQPGVGKQSKTHVLFQALGDIDELNSILGIILQKTNNDILKTVQNDLFDVGSHLCTYRDDKATNRITADYIIKLEVEIEKSNAKLPPLTSFILPGGGEVATWLHFARTVCRRAERSVWATIENTDHHILGKYLNRLSDLLFVLARSHSENEVLWQPGKNK